MMTITREEKKRKTKRAIIKAAIHLFAEKGFDKTSIEELARAAGIGKGTIYTYFQNKAEIFYAFCEDQLEFVRNELAEKTDPGASVIDQSMTVFMGDFIHVTRNSEFGRFFMQQVLFPEERDKNNFAEVDNKWLELLLSIYQRAQERNELRKDIDPLYLAGHFYALYILVVSSWYSGRIEREEVEPAMRLLFEQAVEGLAPSAALQTV
ncbi:MAG: TetR/AcrR family transcriptional regulator [Desulfopila sp.]|jgi:AcrR family transcriptional regulator|nr:TetR/AcrR family transcriptional regulator [Desulfopila sp.]